MKRVGVLPSLVTLANGWCGLLAIYKVLDGDFYEAAWLILLAMVFDVLDGKVARIAGSTSRFGAQLDSLSDAISFGVAPAFLTKAVVEDRGPWGYDPKLLAVLTGVFALCALARLARYNVEHASGEGSDRRGKGVSVFSGIPTPGAAGVVASLVFLAYDPRGLWWYRHVLIALPWLCLVLGFLMVSRVPYLHFGTIFLQGRRDFRFLFPVIVLLALLTKFPQEVCATAFALYAVSGAVPIRSRARPGEGGLPPERTEPADIPDGV